MAKLLALLFLPLVLASCASAAVVAFSGDHLPFTLLSGGGGGAECRGTVAECLAGDELELGAGEAAHRRVLYGHGYISYAALRRDSVPCSRRGASYYNCRPGAQANPYSRGCSAITRCRG